MTVVVNINTTNLKLKYGMLDYDIITPCLRNYTLSPQADRPYILSVMLDIYNELSYTKEDVKDVVGKLESYVDVNILLTTAIELHTDITRLIVNTIKAPINKVKMLSVSNNDVVVFEVG